MALNLNLAFLLPSRNATILFVILLPCQIKSIAWICSDFAPAASCKSFGPQVELSHGKRFKKYFLNDFNTRNRAIKVLEFCIVGNKWISGIEVRFFGTNDTNEQSNIPTQKYIIRTYLFRWTHAAFASVPTSSQRLMRQDLYSDRAPVLPYPCSS